MSLWTPFCNFCIPWQIDAYLDNWSFLMFVHLHLQDKNIPLQLLSTSPAFLSFGSLTPLHHNWKRNLAPRIGQVGEKRADRGTQKKVSACGGQILRVASSWARKGAKLPTLRLFLFPVVVNCTRCVITVIAARQRERSWHQQMFSPSLNFQMATKALLKSGPATLWKRDFSEQTF